MELVPNSYLTVETIRDVKFNLKPSCTICMEVFDAKVRIPKVLECGHSICVNCIDSMLKSIEISHTGNGEVFTSFSCPICRRSMSIPGRGASGFSNNHQLLDAIAPHDSRYVTCNSCNMNGCETSFHICRQCIISTHNFDIQTIIDAEPPVHPDNMAICSTCVLRNHNTPQHTIIDYPPIRLDHQFKRNQVSVDVLRSQMVEKFADVRDILKMLPLVVEKKEAAVNKLLDLMRRAKNRQSQDVIFEKYKQEMNDIIKILSMVKKDGGSLNEKMTEKVKILETGNENINGVHCLTEVTNMREHLKIFENIPNQQQEETFSSDSESQPADHSHTNNHQNNEELVTVIGTYENDNSFWNIVESTIETTVFNINRLYQLWSSRSGDSFIPRNNYNQELVDINQFKMIMIFAMGIVTCIAYLVMF